MSVLQDLLLPSLAAFLVPGLLAWFLARRRGLGVFWVSLVIGALVMLYGWITANPNIAPEAAGRHALTIYFILLPSFMSLVLGSIVGAWQHRLYGAP